jgi:subtilisin-like proprotein convertase family protein
MFIQAGTLSEILNRRKNDNSTKGFKGWAFMSVHFWGENPSAVWTVKIGDGEVS